MDYKILIIRNSLRYDIDDDLTKFRGWIERATPLKVSFDTMDMDIPVSYKDFGVKMSGISYFGLDGIKEKLRSEKIVPGAYYHSIIFLYQFEQADLNKLTNSGQIAAWTYPNPFLDLDAFIEVPSTYLMEQTDTLYRIFTHEIMHAFHRRCWWQNIATKDTMDRYDKEQDIDSKDGNRARNIAELSGKWMAISALPKLSLYIYLLNALVGMLKPIKNIVISEKKISKINSWAEAIKEYEGWFKGSRSYRNNNPGNLKYAEQVGTTGKDPAGFAIFKDYAAGFAALIHQLRIAAEGKSKVYNKKMSLLEFFKVYAPSHDNNDPNAYALFVAQRIKVDPKIQIAELL